MKFLSIVILTLSLLVLPSPQKADACPNAGLTLSSFSSGLSLGDLIDLQAQRSFSFAGNGFQQGFGSVPLGGGVFNLSTGAGAANVNIGGFGRNFGGRNFTRGRNINRGRVIRQRNVQRQRNVFRGRRGR